MAIFSITSLFTTCMLYFEMVEGKWRKKIMTVSKNKWMYSSLFYLYSFTVMLNELSIKRWYVSFWNVSIDKYQVTVLFLCNVLDVFADEFQVRFAHLDVLGFCYRCYQ
jgi:hypothetical protein